MHDIDLVIYFRIFSYCKLISSHIDIQSLTKQYIKARAYINRYW